uniref:Small ribosomal subunit protein mS40 n=1 Tax=Taeniopygia guttata TaxID=59729 RepID=A0A674G718_TAEGU
MTSSPLPRPSPASAAAGAPPEPPPAAPSPYLERPWAYLESEGGCGGGEGRGPWGLGVPKTPGIHPKLPLRVPRGLRGQPGVARLPAQPQGLRAAPARPQGLPAPGQARGEPLSPVPGPEPARGFSGEFTLFLYPFTLFFYPIHLFFYHFPPFFTQFHLLLPLFPSLQNVKLLDQFICPHSGVIFHPIHTGICMKQHRRLSQAIAQAQAHGLLWLQVPFVPVPDEDFSNRHAAVGRTPPAPALREPRRAWYPWYERWQPPAAELARVRRLYRGFLREEHPDTAPSPSAK